MSLHSFIHSCHYTCCCVRDSDITGDRKLVTGNSLYIGGCAVPSLSLLLYCTTVTLCTLEAVSSQYVLCCYCTVSSQYVLCGVG